MQPAGFKQTLADLALENKATNGLINKSSDAGQNARARRLPGWRRKASRYLSLWLCGSVSGGLLPASSGSGCA